MLWILTAAAVASGANGAAPSRTLAPVTVQATATVRIVSGVRLHLDAAFNEGAPKARDAVVTMKDGTQQPARLIEFE